MPKGDVETFHEEGAWYNRIEGEHDAFSGAHSTREEAVAVGRETAKARQVEHIVRHVDGTVGDRSTYGHDPRDIKG